MKKKLSFSLLGLVFVIFSLSTNALAIQNDTSYQDGQIISESDSLDEAYLMYVTEDDISALKDMANNSINPMADEHQRSKTITKYYANFSQIPEHYPYTEYWNGHWWSGTLKLTKAELVSSGYKATFSGHIYAYY